MGFAYLNVAFHSSSESRLDDYFPGNIVFRPPLSNALSSHLGPLSVAGELCRAGSYFLHVVLLEGILSFAILVWVFSLASPM